MAKPSPVIACARLACSTVMFGSWRRFACSTRAGRSRAPGSRKLIVGIAGRDLPGDAGAGKVVSLARAPEKIEPAERHPHRSDVMLTCGRISFLDIGSTTR